MITTCPNCQHQIEYLTVAQAAVLRNVTTRTIQNWIFAGLPHLEISSTGKGRGKYLIKKSDVVKWRQGRTGPKR